jgi:hypothetical protein
MTIDPSIATATKHSATRASELSVTESNIGLIPHRN